MELGIVGYSNAIVRVWRKLDVVFDVLCIGLSESGKRHWSAEK